MRLIDADELNKNVIDKISSDVHINTVLNAIVNLVDEQPTALDVDEVIRELQEECWKPREDYYDMADVEFDDWYTIGLTKAIEILKKRVDTNNK